MSEENLVKQIVNLLTKSWTKHLALIWIETILVVINVSLGIAILAGGKERFDYPTYQPLIDMTNGNTWIWGLWIIGSAVLMSLPVRLPQILGLWLGMTWNIMWCSLFAVALVEYPTAAATSTVAFGGFAMINAALLTARIIDKKEG